MKSWNEMLKGAWCSEDLLTQEECDQLIDMAREAGLEQQRYTEDTRHYERVKTCITAPELSERMWERLRDKIPQEIVIGEGSDFVQSGFGNDPDPDLAGRWTPSRIHPTINVAYCSGRGHLAAHRDDDLVMGEHERSFLTINGYLTARPTGSGGATRFLVDNVQVQGADIVVQDSDVLHRVESDKAGKAVVFYHGLMHDGEPLAEDSPPKWIFRSAIHFQRDPSTAPQLSHQQKEARQALKEAESAEQGGRIPEAIKLYNRAYRLDPSLEQ